MRKSVQTTGPSSLPSLAASDRSNKGWRRDLAISYGKVGDVLVLAGKA